jgi:hypothetical protein
LVAVVTGNSDTHPAFFPFFPSFPYSVLARASTALSLGLLSLLPLSLRLSLVHILVLCLVLVLVLVSLSRTGALIVLLSALGLLVRGDGGGVGSSVASYAVQTIFSLRSREWFNRQGFRGQRDFHKPVRVSTREVAYQPSRGLWCPPWTGHLIRWPFFTQEGLGISLHTGL